MKKNKKITLRQLTFGITVNLLSIDMSKAKTLHVNLHVNLGQGAVQRGPLSIYMQSVK